MKFSYFLPLLFASAVARDCPHGPAGQRFNPNEVDTASSDTPWTLDKGLKEAAEQNDRVSFKPDKVQVNLGE
jgi:hypothetical protein